MKRMITVWLLASTAGSLKAQTPDEWFKQKETQIKYLLEQIVALKSYGDMVNKGYNIAQNGLATIFNCKNKDDERTCYREWVHIDADQPENGFTEKKKKYHQRTGYQRCLTRIDMPVLAAKRKEYRQRSYHIYHREQHHRNGSNLFQVKVHGVKLEIK